MNSIDGYSAAQLVDYAFFVGGNDSWNIRIHAPGSPLYRVHQIGNVCGEPNSILLQDAQTGRLFRLTTDDATIAIFKWFAVLRWVFQNDGYQEQESTAPSKAAPRRLATERVSARVSSSPKSSVPRITVYDRDFLTSLGIQPNLEVDES